MLRATRTKWLRAGWDVELSERTWKKGPAKSPELLSLERVEKKKELEAKSFKKKHFGVSLFKQQNLPQLNQCNSRFWSWEMLVCPLSSKHMESEEAALDMPSSLNAQITLALCVSHNCSQDSSCFYPLSSA